MKIGIFKSFDASVHENVAAACRDLGVDYEIIDILSEKWLENVQKSDCNGFFCPSNSSSQERKTILDERYYFVSQLMKKPIYPDFLGGYIHESKRSMAAWLELYGYPHAKTHVFTEKQEAIEYLNNCNYPIVSKANIGSCATRVEIIKNKRKAKSIVNSCFSIFNNKLSKLCVLSIGKIYNTHIKGIKLPDRRYAQKDYVIFQDYFPGIQYEWRILKVGDSFFGHQKLLKDGYASGSGLVGWVAPPQELLYLVKDLCDKGGFLCMDVDIFENDKGEYCINELQSFFGSFSEYQMKIDNVPGRYVFKDNQFIFEEGCFNTFGSNRLKIEHFVKLLNNGYCEQPI